MDVTLKNPLEAQYSVLGSLIIEPSLMGEAVMRISEQDFTDERCRVIYRTLRRMFTDGAAADPVLLADSLPKGYADVIVSVMDATPTAAHIWEYADIMRQQSRLSRIRELGVKLASDSMDIESAGKLIEELNGLKCEKISVRRMDMHEALRAFAARQQKKPEYLPWGMPALDDRIYAEPGDFIVIGGYPSAGKTALALRLSYRQAENRRVGFYSLETKDYKLAERLITSVAQIDFGRVKRRNLSKEDYEAVGHMTGDMVKHNLNFIEAAGMTVEDIRADALANRYDIVYIDYLQLISAGDREDFSRVTQISIGLHQMSQTTGITVIALSQLTRAENSKGKTAAPTMHSLRQSGQIEQDADVVMLLYKEQPNEADSLRILHVAKNKEGRTGMVKLKFNGSIQSFAPAREPLASQIANIPKTKKKAPDAEQGKFTDLGSAEWVPF